MEVLPDVKTRTAAHSPRHAAPPRVPVALETVSVIEDHVLHGEQAVHDEAVHLREEAVRGLNTSRRLEVTPEAAGSMRRAAMRVAQVSGGKLPPPLCSIVTVPG